MFRQIIFLTFITLTLGEKIKEIIGYRTQSLRIVGGYAAEIEDYYPYEISLIYNDSHICGGSIISEYNVITAAHCTDGCEPEELSIRANSTYIDQGGIVINVTTIYQNPYYDDVETNFDIAILELAEPLTFGPGIQSVGLPNATDQISDGAEVSISGWGVIEENGIELSPYLLAVNVNIISNEECQRQYEDQEITNVMICASVNGGGKDSCQGDSGGPLVSSGLLWGIVSWGYGCGDKIYPGVYARVTALRDYITEITGL